MISSAKVYERTQDVVICYTGDRRGPISILQKANYDSIEVPQSALELSGRSMNREYQDKIVGKVLLRFANKVLLPYPIRFAVTIVKSAKYIWKGLGFVLKGKIEVALLDGVAIGVSVLRGDMETAASDVISLLHDQGFTKIVMMTGDSERTASAVANKIGVDEYYSEVLPEDKAAFVEKEHAKGRKVIMIGDGVNDSPALSAADVGIAISMKGMSGWKTDVTMRDGKGYPIGKSGVDIPIGARIIAICDSIDAITSNRCYRKAHDFDYCYKEIEKNLGKMYDPNVGQYVLDNWEEITSAVNR